MDFFHAEKINERLTAIRSLTGEIMYLIKGETKAVLVDTDLGVKGLGKLVAELTDLPLEVVLTHGHIDHAMGAPEFETVYMNEKDIPVYQSMRAVEGRKGYIAGNFGGKLPEGMTDDDFLENPEIPPFLPLNDRDVFELGGVRVEAYALPGHTPGSMVFLIPEERVLIMGDACNTFTFLFDSSSLPIESYKKQLTELKEKLDGKYDRIWLCHHLMEVPPTLIDGVLDVCDDIMAGNTDDVPFDFMGNKAYIAKEMGPEMQRTDGGLGNIVYNKNQIFE